MYDSLGAHYQGLRKIEVRLVVIEGEAVIPFLEVRIIKPVQVSTCDKHTDAYADLHHKLLEYRQSVGQ